MTAIQQQLFAQQDLTYRDFSARLMPTVPKEQVIGVRTPVVRRMAKELAGSAQAREFLSCLPHTYFEENNLHAFLLERIADFPACLAAVERFLPYVDNWATCDQLCPRAFQKQPAALLESVQRWLASDHVYTVRFGIGMLMRWFLDDDFSPAYLQWVAALRSDEYYINMMIAWYFATALAKQYDSTVPFLESGCLPVWTHNKAIQKARESLRIPPERKQYLKTLKRA